MTREAKTSEELMNLSRGSMRTRSTSDKRSEDERRTNQPCEVHPELRTEERDEDRAGLPTQPPKFRELFRSQPCGTRAEEGEELKNHNPLELQKLERGETKRS